MTAPTVSNAALVESEWNAVEQDAFYDRLIDEYPFPLSHIARNIKAQIAKGNGDKQTNLTRAFFEQCYRLMTAVMLPSLLAQAEEAGLGAWKGLESLATSLDLRRDADIEKWDRLKSPSLGTIADSYLRCLEFEWTSDRRGLPLPAILEAPCLQKDTRKLHAQLGTEVAALRNSFAHVGMPGSDRLDRDLGRVADGFLRRLVRLLPLWGYRTVWVRPYRRDDGTWGRELLRVDHENLTRYVLECFEAAPGEVTVTHPHVALMGRADASSPKFTLWPLHPLVRAVISVDELVTWWLFVRYESDKDAALFVRANPQTWGEMKNQFESEMDKTKSGYVEMLDKYRLALLSLMGGVVPGRDPWEVKAPTLERYVGYQRELEDAAGRFADVANKGVHLLFHGLGGVGKTQFVAELVKRLQKARGERAPRGVVWIEGSKHDDPLYALEDALGERKRLASTKESDRSRKLDRLLQDARDGRLLVVLDNATRECAWHRPFVKKLLGHDLILTSRETAWPDVVARELCGLGEKASVELFWSEYAGGVADAASSASDVETRAIGRLVAALSYHPLTIRIVASTLRQQDGSVVDWMKGYDGTNHLLRHLNGLSDDNAAMVEACVRLAAPDLTRWELRVLDHLSLWGARDATREAVVATLGERVLVRHGAPRLDSAPVIPLHGGQWSLVLERDAVILRDRESSGCPDVVLVQMDHALAHVSVGDLRDGRRSVVVASVSGVVAVVRLIEDGDLRVDAIDLWVAAPGHPSVDRAGWEAVLRANDRDETSSDVGPDGWLRRPPGSADLQLAHTPDSGVMSAVATLKSRSLVESRSERLGLHSLVSQVVRRRYVADSTPAERRIYIWYLRCADSILRAFGQDEPNLRAAVDWIFTRGSQVLPDAELLEAVRGALPVLTRRCRWSLVVSLLRWRLDWDVHQPSEVLPLQLKLADALWRSGELGLAEVHARHASVLLHSTLERDPVAAPVDEECRRDLVWLPFGVRGAALEEQVFNRFRPYRNRPEMASVFAGRLGAFLMPVPDGVRLWRSLADATAPKGTDAESVPGGPPARAERALGHFAARYRVADSIGMKEVLDVAKEARAHADREDDDSLREAALIWRVEAELALGPTAETETHIQELEGIAGRTGSAWALLNVKLQRIFALLRQRRWDDAFAMAEDLQLGGEIPRAGHAPPVWYVAPYVALCAGRSLKARQLLEAQVSEWSVQTVDGRWWTHALTAWLALSEGGIDAARSEWGRARAYERRFPAATRRERHPELFRSLEPLDVVPAVVDQAEQAIWGGEERWWIRARVANFDASPLRATMPLFLRPYPVTVRELLDYCSVKGVPVPLPYRMGWVDDVSEGPARFVSFNLAEGLCRSIGYSLPGGLTERHGPEDEWSSTGRTLPCELPDSAAWEGIVSRDRDGLARPLSPRLRALLGWGAEESTGAVTGGIVFASVEAWWRGDPLCQRLRMGWTSNLSRDARVHAPAVIRADCLTAVDKWRLLVALDSRGVAGLGAVGRAALALAAQDPEPAWMVHARVRRLGHDVATLLHLVGLETAPARGLWLRPACMISPTRTTMASVGAVGALAGGGAQSLLVSGEHAWADVFVWPSRPLDPTRYDEGAHPWCRDREAESPGPGASRGKEVVS